MKKAIKILSFLFICGGLLSIPFLSFSSPDRPVAKVDSITPSSGQPGDWVVIKGENLGKICWSGTGCAMGVCFGSACSTTTAVPPVIDYWTPTEIKVKVPDGAASGPIKVNYRVFYDYGDPSGKKSYLLTYKITGPEFTVGEAPAEEWGIVGELGVGGVNTLAEYNGKLYAATTIGGGKIFVYDGTSWTEAAVFGQPGLGSGVVIQDFTIFEGKLYGSATVLDGSRVYAFDGNTWELDLFQEGIQILPLAAYNNRLYAACAGGQILVREAGSWYALDWPSSNWTDAIVFQDKLYIAGGKEVLVWDGTDTKSYSIDFGWGSQDLLHSIEIYQNQLYTLSYKGKLFRYVASSDEWQEVVSTPLQQAMAMKAFEGKLYLGGSAGQLVGTGAIYTYQNGQVEESLTQVEGRISSFEIYNSELYAGDEQGKVYLLGGGKKISKKEAPVSPPAAPIEAKRVVGLIRLKGTPGVWAINEQGKRRPIQDKSIFESHGFNWKDVEEVSESKMESYSETEPLKLKDETLVKAEGDIRVYVIKDGKRCHISSPDVFRKEGYSWREIKEVPARVLNMHEKGASIK